MTFARTLPMLVVVLILTLAADSHAQGIPETIQKELGKLVGEWTVEVQLGEADATKARLTGAWSPNQDCVIWHWSGPDPVTGENSTMSGMLGWDGSKKRVFERGFASNGESFVASHNITEKRWRSPTTSTRLMDGSFKEEKSLRIFAWTSDDELVITSRNRQLDGEEAAEIVSTFRRSK